MNWVLLVWTSVAAGCFTLAFQHVVVWVHRRQAWENLLFASCAVSVASIAMVELAMMNISSAAGYGEALRWLHVPIFTGTASVIGFVWFYFRTGRRWLALTVIGLRALALGINFLVSPNLNYSRILEVREGRLLGQTIYYAIGTQSPWQSLGNLTGLLFIIYVVDAAFRLWRKGDAHERWRALLIGGGIAVFLLIGHGQATLLHAGVIHGPYFISLAFSAVIAAMAWELSQEILRAARVTEQLKLSEASLRESEERMELAAEAAGLGLWEWNLVDHTVWATDKARELYGVLASEGRVSVERFMEAVHEEDRRALRERIDCALSHRAAFEADYRVVLPSGVVSWIAARGRGDFDQEGNPLRLQGVSMDISHRKQAEAELQEYRNEVAHLSRVTTMGQISGSLAHELNQPLGAILANTEAAEMHLLREKPDLEELRSILADIRKDDLRAGEIIRGMRAFLRRESLKMESLQVGDLMRDTMKMVAADATARRTSLSLQVGDNLPAVQADRVHMQQVLVNLMVNGMDAMNTSPLSMRRLLLRATLVEGVVEISVSDAGTGIAPAHMDLIFQPFFTSKRGGLGLGLAISHFIVQAHGGTLVLENNPDCGATARLRLPLVP